MASRQCVMKSKGGQYVTVKKLHEGLKLCAVDQQDSKEAPSMDVWEEEDNQLAFKFQLSDVCHYLKVVGEDLKLDKFDIQTKLTKNHLFEKYDIKSGEHYSLRTVVEPKQYLYIKENKRNIFGLSPNSEDCVQIRDDKSDKKTST